MTEQDQAVLEAIAEQLETERKTKGICPSQKQGIEIDGAVTNYCPLPAINCKHLGKSRCYDNEDCKIENHNECLYEGEKK